MKNYKMLLLLVASLFILFASSISHAGDGEDHVLLSNAPVVTVSLANNTTVNVTYSQMFLGTSVGVVGASLGAQSWNITNTTSGYMYRSSFDLQPISGTDSADLYRSIMNLSDQTSLGSDSTPSLPVTVVIHVANYNGSVSSLSVRNLTNMMNASISNINVSTLKLSFSVYLSLTSQNIGNGSVDLVMVQTLGGGENSRQFDANQVDAYEKSSDLGNGVALVNNSVGDLRALYWWNNNYTYNGMNATDYAMLLPGEQSIQIAFVFKTNATQGQFTLTQDPYLSVNGANLVGGKISIYTQPIINYLIQHVEFLALGISVGSVAFIALYSSYRKNRIKL